MKREFLKDLGLGDDAIDQIMRENGIDIEKVKSEKTVLDGQVKQLEATIEANNKTLEDLKKSTGDAETLKKTIETLQADNKKASEEYETTLKDLKLTNAIKIALAGKAQDEELVAGLFDKSKLILGDDGAITGLEEQLKSIQETKTFLFKAPEQSKQGFVPIGGNNPQNKDNNNQQPSLKDAVAAHFQAGN